ncbi:hypothetical protein KEM09_19790 [Carboxylicivirga mesophila]|uniref:Uncharacterized protein n=1 Tax=Carboxylicivirga mesophila TaxID=1166478 RepID=A0ABS5KGM4_9BACT|nr:hypothetical protein [Carboxylicivirga mesophila]MBS2213661.1 hypothetical protein [Carboxylicivirga mesophila]
MTKEKYVYRYYKISISIGPFYFCKDTRVYKLPRLIMPYVVGILYSILTLLLGFWGLGLIHRFRGLRNSLEAIHVNLTGGEDITQKVDDHAYDERTNFIYKNILRETCEKISKKEVEIILEIQDDYLETQSTPYTDENLNYMILNLGKLDIHRIQREELKDIFDGIVIYDKQFEEEIYFAS